MSSSCHLCWMQCWFISRLPILGHKLFCILMQDPLSDTVHNKSTVLDIMCATLNSVTVEKWSLNFREMWHPHSSTMNPKYYCLGWPSCNRSQGPAVLNFANWNEDINLGHFPPFTQSPFSSLHIQVWMCTLLHILAYALAHTHAHTPKWRYLVFYAVCVCVCVSYR